MSTVTPEYWQAIKWVDEVAVDSGKQTRREEVIGFYKGKREDVDAFLDECREGIRRLVPVTFFEVDKTRIENLKAAKGAVLDAEAQVRLIKQGYK